MPCRYCVVICSAYFAASIADACAYTMFRMAGDALACRLRRRVLHCTMHRGLHELAQVLPPPPSPPTFTDALP
jgi:hypothetical protein